MSLKEALGVGAIITGALGVIGLIPLGGAINYWHHVYWTPLGSSLIGVSCAVIAGWALVAVMCSGDRPGTKNNIRDAFAFGMAMYAALCFCLLEFFSSLAVPILLVAIFLFTMVYIPTWCYVGTGHDRRLKKREAQAARLRNLAEMEKSLGISHSDVIDQRSHS